MPRMPGAPASAMVLLCYAGAPGTDVREADAAIEPLLELGTVTEATIAERRYADVLEDAQHPPGIRMVGRNTMVRRLDDDVLGRDRRGPPRAGAERDRAAEPGRSVRAGSLPTPRRSRTATRRRWSSGRDVPARGRHRRGGRRRRWGRGETVAARGTGTYVNFQGSATAEDLAAAYPPATMTRLAAVKRAYDPGNVFALNHNIAP